MSLFRFCELIDDADTAVQKRFDAVVHAFMRATGVSKRGMRRNAWGASLLGLTAHALLRDKPFGFWNVVTFVLYAFILWHDDRCDERAEVAGEARSKADEAGPIRKLLGWLGVAHTIALWRVPPNSLGYNLSLLAVQCVWLFQGYLCGTSPQAPAKKRKVAPLAQMARAAC